MQTRKPRILIVEDEKKQRELYREGLEEQGYEVIEAGDGNEAIEIMERLKKEGERLDLVVSDVSSWEKGEGIEVIGRILNHDYRIPLIIHSAYTSYKDTFLSWLADAWVNKCSDLTELKEVVRRVLEIGRAHV